ncbi:neutral zinc metallopeptidase [Nonomuraea roseoviolacea subsp. roseoviolacea]|uniref:Metalloprotease n=1 Tax=Nonomuraea roseoviolacea subsp. carminata TaxID=160689 RepID=A0ABT1K0A2_9ACTN|nr:neutral zinc metallopeptidase [Nonomuraea roseoviolacea]MCP2347430.1 putative metalloprotease [Nonomuraea roseoviolacea subsp. carminata]
MDFRDDVNLDSSQVEDVGGSGGGGGGGGFPGGMVLGGGGIVTLIVMVVVFLLNNVGGGGGDKQPAQRQPATNLSQECKTGKDADQSEKCRVIGVVNSIQDYWKDEVSGYRPAKTILYSGGVRTACGAADSSVGPFYCPGDQRVYLDLSFFDDLHSRFGAKGGPFAQAYVIAHEYGHHVQNLTGALEGGGSVATELQADCYAGVWAKNAIDTGFYDKPFTDTDIAEALDAAAAVGDDRIQQRTQGRVDPDSFTHGSSEQRVNAFKQGYGSGKPSSCATR